MEASNTRRRLKRTSAVTGFSSSEEPGAEQPTQDTLNSPSTQEIAPMPSTDILGLGVSSISVYTEEEADDKPAECPPVKKKPYKKGNRLVDYELFHEDSQRVVLEDVQIPTRNKTAKSIESLLEKCEKKNVFADTLAKSILQDNSQAEKLIISAPSQVHGFFSKRICSNERDQLKEKLRNAINSRKTTHLGLELVFEKSQSDFVALEKQQKEEDKPSMLIEDIIQLEEGDGSVSEVIENQLSELEDVDEDQDFQKDLELAEEIEALSDSKSIALNPEIEAKNSDAQNHGENEEDSLDDNAENKLIRNLSDSHTRCDSNFLLSEAKASDFNEKPLQSQEERESAPMDNSTAPDLSPLLSRFIDNMAEVGSDNEDHDYVIKRVSDHDELEEDGELEELIDNSKVNLKRKQLASKHMGEMMVKDYQDLVKVINADFRRRRDDYLDESAGLGSKMMKLMKDKQREMEHRNPMNAFGRQFKMKEANSSEEEDDFSKIHLLRTSSELRNFRSQNLVIDDTSISYLGMIQKPQNFKTVRSLLNDPGKSNNLKIFRESSMSSARAFSFKDNSK